MGVFYSKLSNDFRKPFLLCILNIFFFGVTHLQSAIGSVASAAEQAFVPYAERVLELMKSFLVLTNDVDLCSRARATELVGIVAMSVGRTGMEPILPPYIEAAISVITVSPFDYDLCLSYVFTPNV